MNRFAELARTADHAQKVHVEDPGSKSHSGIYHVYVYEEQRPQTWRNALAGEISRDLLRRDVGFPLAMSFCGPHYSFHYSDPRKDPKRRTPNSRLKYCYGVDYRTLRWIYLESAHGSRSVLKCAESGLSGMCSTCHGGSSLLQGTPKSWLSWLPVFA